MSWMWRKEPYWLLRLFPALFYFNALTFFLFLKINLISSSMGLFWSYPVWYQEISKIFLSQMPFVWFTRALFLVTGIFALSERMPRLQLILRLSCLVIFSVYLLPTLNHAMRGEAYFPVVVGLILMCFLPVKFHRNQTWILEMLRYQYLMMFFAAGVAKLVHGGLAWITGNTLYSILKMEYVINPHMPIPLGALIPLLPPWIFNAAAALVVFVEAGCIVGVFFPRARKWNGLGLMVFFMGQYLFMGWIFNYWPLFILPLLVAGEPLEEEKVVTKVGIS